MSAAAFSAPDKGQAANALPLSGIRVLDLSRVLVGPFASQMLGDLGAEVIKVERPGVGDDSRGYGPPFVANKETGERGDSAFFVAVNRNKNSVTVDLATPEGQQIIRRLAAKSDVLIENFKVGDLARYGLDHEALRQVNPRLIYCSITGFGQTGPYRNRVGYDLIFQAQGGLMSVTGNPDDSPGGGPMKVGLGASDVIAAQYALNAIVAALYHRDVNGGSGQHIDLSLLDSLVAFLSHQSSHYLVSGEVPVRRGTEGAGGMPSRCFACADGDIVLTAGNDRQYRSLCEVLGRPELADDPRFVSNPLRTENRRELVEALSLLIARWEKGTLLQALEAAKIPAAPINDLKQVFEDPQILHRRMTVEVDHPLSGDLRLVANPIRFSETPIESYRTPPLLGSSTRKVLVELLSMSDAEIDRLAGSGVI